MVSRRRMSLVDLPSTRTSAGRARVLYVRSLGHAVGSGVEENDKVAGLDGRKGSVAGEEVAGFADWADYVDYRFLRFGWLLDWNNFVVGVVERRADEVVHGGVGDDEGLAAVLLHVEDAGEECACLGDDEAAGLEEEMRGFVAEAFGQSFRIFFYLLCRIEGVSAVVDAETSASVNVADVVSVAAKIGDECGDPGEGSGEGLDFADLGTDVDGDACGIEPL